MEPSSAPSPPIVENDIYVEFENFNGSPVDICSLNESILAQIGTVFENILSSALSGSFEFRDLNTSKYNCDQQINLLKISYVGVYNDVCKE